jgi:aarF domain-containing kinase
VAPTPMLPKRKFRERAVPSSRMSRAFGFAGMGAGLAWGAASDAVTSAFTGGSDGQGGRAVLSEANARRLANGLCRMRGAALKIGQMMSIQDEDMMPPQVAAALEQVRQSADVMPRGQLEATLTEELGDDWRSKVAEFEWEPSAAASIGQVHKARLHDGRQVAMKIQYPGAHQW